MDEKIDVNRADEETLASLPGIGPKRAAQIVEYRTAVHPFEELIELAAVPGISERMVREFAAQLTVNGAEIEEPAEPEIETTAEEVDEEPVMVMMLEDAPERPEVDEEPEPEPEPEAATAVTPSPPEVMERQIIETVQRRHFHLWQHLLGVVIGAIGGVLLTLLLLYLLNGTLRFASESRAADLQLQLDEETSAIRQSQSSMTDEMGDLAGRVAALDNELAASDEAIGAVEADVTGLEEETAAINERLETIDLAAEKFDTFLIGLRDLLFAVQGAPTATATITGTTTTTTTVTPEETAETPEMTPTPTPAAETPEAGSPTRTPRPTATPLIENE